MFEKRRDIIVTWTSSSTVRWISSSEKLKKTSISEVRILFFIFLLSNQKRLNRNRKQRFNWNPDSNWIFLNVELTDFLDSQPFFTNSVFMVRFIILNEIFAQRNLVFCGKFYHFHLISHVVVELLFLTEFFSDERKLVRVSSWIEERRFIDFSRLLIKRSIAREITHKIDIKFWQYESFRWINNIFCPEFRFAPPSISLHTRFFYTDESDTRQFHDQFQSIFIFLSHHSEFMNIQKSWFRFVRKADQKQFSKMRKKIIKEVRKSTICFHTRIV